MRKFSWITLLIILIIAGSPVLAQAQENDVLAEVRYLLDNYYVDEIPAAVLKAPTVKRALEVLGDEHTKYWTKKDYAGFLDNMEPHFAGLGIYMEAAVEGMRVIGIIMDTPAAEAGLKAEDIILSVNGLNLKGMSVEEGQSLLMGPEGSEALLLVKRGESLLSFSVIRAVIELPTVTGEVIDRHIGYIDINSFAGNTHSEFDRLLEEMDEEADVWIIDLRDNTGGFLKTALSLAGYFIGDDVALYMEEKEYISAYRAYRQAHMIDEPVILLVNGNSASSSEILAAALRDHRKALLIGERTYGKGSVQSIFELSNGDFLKITVAYFYSPLKEMINEAGIEPDIEVKGSEALDRAILLIELEGKLPALKLDADLH